MMRNGDQEVGYQYEFEYEDEDGKTMKIDKMNKMTMTTINMQFTT